MVKINSLLRKGKGINVLETRQASFPSAILLMFAFCFKKYMPKLMNDFFLEINTAERTKCTTKWSQIKWWSSFQGFVVLPFWGGCVWGWALQCRGSETGYIHLATSHCAFLKGLAFPQCAVPTLISYDFFLVLSDNSSIHPLSRSVVFVFISCLVSGSKENEADKQQPLIKYYHWILKNSAVTL